ncbi:MAG: efflux RND transporter permease subunit [Sulfuriferula sp.]
MLTNIVRFSVRFRGIVIALACLLLGYGIYTVFQSRLDVFPEFTPPLIVIQTEAPGLSPEQVEVLVTLQIENALGGTLGMESMRSSSIQGLSMINLVFSKNTDIYRARQLVSEQLNAIAGQLPKGVKSPAMNPLTTSTGTVLGIGLTSNTLSRMGLRTFADWTIKPDILGIPGVASVTVYGGEIKQYQIQVDPQKLVRFGLSLQDVLNVARRATGVRGAGFIENQNQRITLNTAGQTITVDQLAQIVLLQKNGVTIRLGDIGQVLLAPEPPVGGATVEGKPGIVIMVDSQYGADTMTVTHAVEAALNGLQPALLANGITLYPDLFRPANFIQSAISHLRFALLLGAVLVVIVLYLFLFDARTAFISATAIPLSLLTAIIVLHYFGISLNTMTLGGLAIALGEVVDDAIVDVENIYRRLRENKLLPHPLSPAQVVVKASLEVRGAVIYATFVVALVFLPVLTLSGVAGKLFAPLGITYILAILSSLGVALFLTPGLSYLLLARAGLKPEEPRLMRVLKRRYRPILISIEKRSKGVMAILIIAVVGALAVLPFLDTSFLPELREGHYILHMSAVPGTSLQQSLTIGRSVSMALLKIPGIRSVAQRVGRANNSSDVYGTNASEFEIDLKPGLGGDAQAHVLSEIRKATANFTGLAFVVKTFLAERIEETLSGYTAQVVINIFGNNLDTLDGLAQQVAQVLNTVPGATGVTVQAPQGTPQLTIRLKQDQLTRWGFEPIDVLDAIQAAYEGVSVSQIYEGNRIFDVSVLLTPASRQSPVEIGTLPLRNAEGITVPLRQLVDITQTNGRYAVLHSGGRRLQTVTANVRGPALSVFVNEAKKRINAQIAFPKGFYAVFTGDAEAQAQARRDLLINSLMAGVGIVLLLFMALRSTRALLLVMVNLPFALVGGVLILFATGGQLSLGSLVGFVTLFGITLRNSIMLISHYEHLVNIDGMAWGLETAILGASERLAPILMTATVTALGLLPLAIQSGEPGNEIEGPMAIVILGGLITSTILNLLILPTLALRFGHFKKQADFFESPETGR